MPGFWIIILQKLKVSERTVLEAVFAFKGNWQRNLTTDKVIELTLLTSSSPFKTTQTLNPGTHLITLPEGFNVIEVSSQFEADVSWKMAPQNP